MSQHSHSRRPSSETLALAAMRSTSPLPLPLIKPAGKNMHESIALPPIQSLTREFPSRREQQQQQQGFQRDSPPDQHASPYQRKRPGIPGDDHGSPPGTNKRRRVESEETNGSFNDKLSQPPTGSDSNLRRHSKQPSLHERPSTPTQQSQRSHSAHHGHVRHASSGSNIPSTSHDPPTKQEQVSPPAVIVQSPATPSTGVTVNVSTTAWQNEPSQSFSRRISNPSSTPRKGPPSRLNFQTHTSHRGPIDSLAPSIRSAPPVPAQLASNLPPPPLAGNSTWLTNRPSAQQSRPRHTSHLSSSDLPTPRALARDAWPAIPTPTSLRLGARAIVPPTAAANQVSSSTGAAVPAASSPSGRVLITPAVPSPIPTLGSGSGLADKVKFMQKMSDIYDRAASNSHSKNCVTMEEVDKRIRDVVILRDHEILQLKKEVVELQSLLRQRTRPPGSVDEDGDINMHSNPTRTAVPVASSGDTSNILRVSPNPIESTKEGTVPCEEPAGTRLPSPSVNGITSHSPSA